MLEQPIQAANPSVSVGLSTVNGTALTFMRSDAVPALSQAIAPTWSGKHIFSAAQSGGPPSSPIYLQSAAPLLGFQDTSASADNKLWDLGCNSGQFYGTCSNDAISVNTRWIQVSRSGGVPTDVAFPNSTVTLGKGVSADGGGMKHKRVTTGSVNAASTALVTITWGTAFADANYTVVASVLEATTSSLSISVVHIESQTASAVTVRVINNAAGALTGTVHCIAIHD